MLRYSTFITILLTALVCITSVAQDGLIKISDDSKKREFGYEGNVYVAVKKSELQGNKKDQLKSLDAWNKGEYADGSLIFSIPENNYKKFKKKLGTDIYYPNSNLKISDEIVFSENTDIAITFFDKLSLETIEKIKNDFAITSSDFSSNYTQILIGRIDGSLINTLAELPEVAYISAVVEEPIPLDDTAVSFHHASINNANLPMDLKGEGMVVGVGDGGELGDHIDFNERVTNKANGTYANYGNHADKMVGIIVGGGIIKEENAGFAPLANIITQKTLRIFFYLDEYYNQYGMRLTNNSYGSTSTCSDAGEYDYYSRLMDQQMVDHNDLLHVVAAGNNGGNTCNGYPQGYHSVLKTYAPAKNVLTVGGVLLDRTINPSSSKGPVQDGRLKPEIVALSEGITSTGNNYNYAGIANTSAATANVTGAATLVYEKYKNLKGENINGTLLKGVLCNTADDGGNPGPDFEFGYGIMNVKKALENIESENYILGETNAINNTETYDINVTNAQSELKVLLAWSDIPQTTSGVATLKNDLDLEILAPDGTVFQPWTLDPTAANVTNDAIRGLDRINNMEQVTIPNPQTGTYTIQVKTYNLDSPSQVYAISYQTYSEELSITYPAKGMSVGLQETIPVSWDANYLTGVTGFVIEYSLDEGASWLAAGNANATERNFNWNSGNINTEKAQIRVTAQGTSFTSTSEKFNILGTPTGLQVDSPCGGYANLVWDQMADATSYEIYWLQGKEMVLLGTSGTASFLVEKRLEANEEYWFSVKAKYADGNTSRRAEAESVTISGNYPCPWSNDVEISTLSAGAAKGRELTSNSLLDNEHLVIEIINAGDNVVSDIPLKISINGNVTNEVINVSLNPGESHTYTSVNTFDFSDAGNYEIDVKTELALDNHIELSGIIANCTQLENDIVTLPSIQKMELNNDVKLTESTLGIEGIPYMDFYTVNNAGNLFIYDGDSDKVKILEVQNNSEVDDSEVWFTRNLGNTSTYLRMNYKVITTTSTDKVTLSFRASDTDAWTEVKELDNSGEWIINPDIVDLSLFVSGLGQNFTTSTQLRLSIIGEASLMMDEFSLVQDPSVLPVELSSFTAIKDKEDVVLEWVTATEENNDYFEVLVAKGDESYLNDDFKTLETVQGQGTTLEEMTYLYRDIESNKSGIRYYKLKQVDFDGTTTYTDVIPVEFENSSSVSEVKILPNVIKKGQQPNITFELANAAEVKFLLIDPSGRILKSSQQFYEAGNITEALELDTNLGTGIYYVSIQISEEEIITHPLNIQP